MNITITGHQFGNGSYLKFQKRKFEATHKRILFQSGKQIVAEMYPAASSFFQTASHFSKPSDKIEHKVLSYLNNV